MPLYTYLASYKGGTHCAQDRRSNFKGFAALMVAQWPDDCLPAMSPTLQKEAIDKIARAEWSALSNQKHVWIARFDLNGHPFTLHAVQTGA